MSKNAKKSLVDFGRIEEVCEYSAKEKVFTEELMEENEWLRM